MRWHKTLQLVEAHAEGEVGRVITGGVLNIPGETMLDKMDYLNNQDDSLRKFCVLEPRGCAQMSTNLLLPATRTDADVGLIILQGDRAHGMSGSNCICVVTVLLETGIIPMQEPCTVVRLDTPAGLVTASAHCKDGKCQRVSLQMTPAFVEALDVVVAVPGLGTVRCDIAFGGVYYALVDVRHVGLSIVPQAARALAEAGGKIQRALQAMQDQGDLHIQHPQLPSVNRIAYIMFTECRADGELCGATVLPPGRLDRSPCGTGNSARLAVRHARGEVHVGDKVVARSVINSAFDVEFLEETTVGERGSSATDVPSAASVSSTAGLARPAIVSRISGRAWLYGFHHIGLDPSDPYPLGYLLSDTWGDGFDLVS